MPCIECYVVADDDDIVVVVGGCCLLLLSGVDVAAGPPHAQGESLRCFF